jgi:hypothetical protein
MPTKPNKAESPYRVASSGANCRHTNSKTQNSHNDASPRPTPDHTLSTAALALWQSQPHHGEPWNSIHIHVQVQAQNLVHSPGSGNQAPSAPLGNPTTPNPRDASFSSHNYAAASIRGTIR